MKRKIELFMVLFLLIGAIVASWKLSELTAGVAKEQKAKDKKVTVVIDPGHGGEDPGKVGSNDVLEKDLNLKIAKKVIKLLKKEGIQVVTTREDDNVPTAKREDLEQRIKLINETKPELTVCIHQNSFPNASVKGAQVFYYAPSEIGKEVAGIVQEELRTIDSENTREIKANETYYMLKNTEVPTIIVECGFLTNPEEAEKLTNEEYQDKIAKAVFDGIIKWLEKEKK